MIFLYKITNKTGKLTFTCDCDYAETRSRQGDIVYGYARPEGHRVI